MDRVTLGFTAGTIGCVLKSAVNALSSRLSIMGMRNSTVGTDLVLGKTILKRHGVTPWIVGELASSQLGGVWGTIFGLFPPVKGKNTWITRGVQLGTMAWMIDMALGARSIPRAVQGNVTPHDALMWWAQHQVFGIFTIYVLEANPDFFSQVADKVQSLAEEAGNAWKGLSGKGPERNEMSVNKQGGKTLGPIQPRVSLGEDPSYSRWASESTFYIE